jgi:hypothetical protein
MPDLGPDTKRLDVELLKIFELQCDQDRTADIILHKPVCHRQLNASVEHSLRDHLGSP